MSFFNLKRQTSNKHVSKDTLHTFGCKVCPLSKGSAVNSDMEPVGSDSPYFYVLGEFPSKGDDLSGEPFSDDHGAFVKEALAKAIMEIKFNDSKNFTDKELDEFVKDIFRFNNVVRTNTPKNRQPEWNEIECCRNSILEDIKRTQPSGIFALGNSAINWFLGEEGITNWRGRRIPIRVGDHYCWLYPLHNVSYLFRKRTTSRSGKTIISEEEKCFQRDINKAIEEIDDLEELEIVEREEVFNNVHYVTGKNGKKDLKKVQQWLEYLKTLPENGLDIETNGIRPYAEGSKILSISIGTDDFCVCFPLEHKEGWQDKKLKIKCYEYLYDFLMSDTAVIAHNASFEIEWLCYFLGEEIAHGVLWEDTMVMGYCLDTRQGTLNLDFLCLENLGFNLKQISDIDVKNLENTPIEEVLKYNSLDTKYTYKLAQKLRDRLKSEEIYYTYEERITRIPTLVLSQLKGLQVSQEEVNNHDNKLTDRISKLEEEIYNNEDIKKFIQKGNEYNLNSNPNNVKFFRDFLGKVEGYKEDGKYSVDENSLKNIDHLVAKNLLEYRTLAKLRSTYVRSIKEGEGSFIWPDGKVHTNFNACATATNRLSSNAPNVQNFPKRENREIRSVVVAPKGYTLVSIDYGQIEARLIGVASQDEFLKKALWENYDIHLEWAERIAYQYPGVVGGKKHIKDKNAIKKFRSKVKNTFVFPLFFGSWYKPVAADTGVPENLMKPIEEDFWETFAGVKQWQEDLFKFYDDNGYISTLTGFRCRAPLRRNKVINYGIQGSANDVVMDGMNRLSIEAFESGERQLQPILQIHDDLTFAFPKKSLEDDISKALDVMLDPQYDWIDVPIQAEVETGPDWYNMKEVGKFNSNEWFD